MKKKALQTLFNFLYAENQWNYLDTKEIFNMWSSSFLQYIMNPNLFFSRNSSRKSKTLPLFNKLYEQILHNFVIEHTIYSTCVYIVSLYRYSKRIWEKKNWMWEKLQWNWLTALTWLLFFMIYVRTHLFFKGCASKLTYVQSELSALWRVTRVVTTCNSDWYLLSCAALVYLAHNLFLLLCSFLWVHGYVLYYITICVCLWFANPTLQHCANYTLMAINEFVI